MKKRYLYIVVFIVLLVLGIMAVILCNHDEHKIQKIKLDNNVKVDEVIINKDNDSEINNNHREDETKKETEFKDDSNTTIDNLKDNKPQKSENTDSIEKPKPEAVKPVEKPKPKPVPKPKPNQPKPKPVPKPVEIKKPWEEIGISENDYYNKPMWKWARVDFSIDKYKTIDKTKEACKVKGEEYFKEGLGYSCTSINSYSGKYLGEMIKTF